MAAAAAVVLVVLGGSTGCTGTPAPLADTGTVERVLVVSLPGVTWDDVDHGTMPSVRALVDHAALGNLATAFGRGRSDTAAAYLTMGAGTRAVAEGTETGVALGPGEQVNGIDSTDLLQRRFGEPPDGISYPAAGPVADLNDATVYGAEVGLLGDELADAGVGRGVVANADQPDELLDPGTTGAPATLHREAVTMLMGARGTVPEGSVSSDLLEADPNAGFGVALDVDAMAEAFRSSWRGPDATRTVVLVEASDLRRAAAYEPMATPDAAERMRQRALHSSDELVGRLLEAVDPQRDAVLLVGVPTAVGQPDLGIVALSSTDVDDGLLRSATTGRDGYVQLVDVAPTVLDLLGEEHPRSIEGRPFVVARDVRGNLLGGLAGDVRDAAFRDRMVPPVTVAFIAVLAVLLAIAGPWSPVAGRLAGGLRFASFAILGAAAGTFLAGMYWVSPTQPLAYTAVVVGIGLVLAGIAHVAERRRRGAGIVVALGTLVAVIGIDVAIGAPLQVNTVFGYSVAVAGRFAGLGNLAFAIFSAASVLLAAVLARRHGAAGVRMGIAVLVLVVLVDGFPLLGADVGGSLAMVPAFGVTALVLAGRPVRWQYVLALGVLALCTTLTFALVDLARPEHRQTHLARFARLVFDGRWPTLADTVGRRFQASFGGLQAVAWGAVVAIGLVTTVYVLLVDRDRIPDAERRRSWPRPVVAAGAGLLTLALLGWAANDSSFAVPATMLIVVVPVVVDHLLREQEAQPGGASA
jgi:hypothetical protein